MVNMSVLGVIIAARVSTITIDIFLYFFKKECFKMPIEAKKYATTGNSKAIPIINNNDKKEDIYEFKDI